MNVSVQQAVFTPMFGPEYWHFVAAMFLTAGYVVAGIYAVGWLRGRRDRYHKLGFTVPFTVAAILTPVQFFLGDNIARQIYHKQPEKFAAAEIVWNTGTHVPEYLFGRLESDGSVKGGLKIPDLDSFLAGFSANTQVTGLTSVPAADRPTAAEATLVHWTFDIMATIGSVLILLALWYAVYWLWRRDLPKTRWFFRCAALAGVASVITVECGWITTEVGRQPWIVYQYMRVSDAVTPTKAGSLWTMFGIVVVVYVLVFGAFVGVVRMMSRRWRRVDQGHVPPPGEGPETDTPYGPRPEPAAVAPGASGSGGSSGSSALRPDHGPRPSKGGTE
jgi:cytochrome d ubiquinol oxidase subunit I